MKRAGKKEDNASPQESEPLPKTQRLPTTEGAQDADDPGDLKDLPLEKLLTRISEESLSQEAPIFQLPDPILVNIFSLIEHEEILTSVRLVCRKWLVVGRDRDIWNHCNLFKAVPGEALYKFLAFARYAIGVQQLTFPHAFDCDTYERSTEVIDCLNEALVHMPDLRHCATPMFLSQANVKSFCDAIGRYCPLLTSLNMRVCCRLTKHKLCFDMLRRCEHLTALTISSDVDYGCCVTPSFVPVLAECIPNLEEFYFESTNGLAPGYFEALANSSLQLKKLYFPFSEPSTVEDVRCISKMKSLRSLGINVEETDIWGTSDFHNSESPKRITDLLKAITEDGGLCDLTELHIKGNDLDEITYNVTDDGFYYLANNLNKLTVMTLDCLHITDVSLRNVAAHCTKLEKLSLICCFRVTNIGILTLVEKLTKVLKKVKLDHTGSDGLVESIQSTCPHIDVEAIGLDTLKDDSSLGEQSSDSSDSSDSDDSFSSSDSSDSDSFSSSNSDDEQQVYFYM